MPRTQTEAGLVRVDDWTVLPGKTAEVRLNGQLVCKGEVDLVTEDGDVLWILPQAGTRRLYERDDAYEAWASVDPGLQYRLTRGREESEPRREEAMRSRTLCRQHRSWRHAIDAAIAEGLVLSTQTCDALLADGAPDGLGYILAHDGAGQAFRVHLSDIVRVGS